MSGATTNSIEQTKSTSTDVDAQYSIVILSLGAASPTIISTLAKTIDVPSALLLKLCLQAPSVLFSDVTLQEGKRMQHSLEAIGLKVAIKKDAPNVETLYDIAVYVTNFDNFGTAVGELSAFLASTREDVISLLYREPSLIMGDVSTATIECLRERLAGLGVNILAAQKDKSLYDLIYIGNESPIKNGIKSALNGFPVDITNDGLMARGLSFENATKIWSAYGKAQNIFLVNQEFEHWDIWLEACKNDQPSLDALHRITNIPQEVCAKIPEHLPIIISDQVSNAALPALLSKLDTAGFSVRAELATFRKLKLKAKTVRDMGASQAVLAQHQINFDLSKHQFERGGAVLPGIFTDFHARLLSFQLEMTGCEIQMETCT